MAGNLISQPSVTVNIIGASVAVGNTPQKVLFIGQKTIDGSATSGELQTGIGTDKTLIRNLFGQRSMLASMIISARDLNTVTQFDAICLDDDGSAVSATKTFAISGTATEDGTLNFVIGNRDDYSFEIAVSNSDTAENIGDALVSATDSNDNIPATGINTTGTVVYTVANGGTVGSDIGIEIKGSVAGITVSVSETAGSIDPDVSTLFDVIGDERYQTIVWPYLPNINTIKDFLDARFNTTDDVLDGIGILYDVDSKANLIIAGDAQNSQSIVIIGDKAESTSTYLAPALFDIKTDTISKVAALRSLRLTDGASIADIVISRNGALDSFGGPALASKPYFNTPISNLSIIDIGKGFGKQDIEDLKDAGISMIGNNKTRTNIIMGEIVTTYKTDVASNPDISFKFLNYVDTASNVREYFWNNLRSRFAQSRLTEGDLVAGRDIANADLISAFITGLYSDLSGPDYILTQAGENALSYFKENLSVLIDLSIGRATILMETPIVTQFREILAAMQISFSVDG